MRAGFLTRMPAWQAGIAGSWEVSATYRVPVTTHIITRYADMEKGSDNLVPDNRIIIPLHSEHRGLTSISPALDRDPPRSTALQRRERSGTYIGNETDCADSCAVTCTLASASSTHIIMYYLFLLGHHLSVRFLVLTNTS